VIVAIGVVATETFSRRRLTMTLVLSRRIGESIVIAGNVKVQIVDVRGSNVRLGIDAPMDIPVDRIEVRERKMRNRNDETRNA
jgi:carbon storage regulator